MRAAATAGDELCCALGRALRARREQAGLSQDMLAGLVGTGQALVSKWEGGQQAMSVAQLVLVASATGAAPGALLDEALAELAPCAGLALPSERAGYRRPVRHQPATSAPNDAPKWRSRDAAPEVVLEEPAPLAPGALDALAALLVRAGVPRGRAGWAASLLEEAAAAGVCQVGFSTGPGCDRRPSRLAVRVDRGGRVVARVLCEAHAARLDDRWAVVGPEKGVRALGG